AFSDQTRDSLGAFSVQYAANGHCFTSTSASFTIYNSMVNSIAVSGAPATSSLLLDVFGEGFVYPGLLGGACQFRLLTSGTSLSVRTSLSALSTSHLQCPTPAAGVVGEWELSVLQNGVSADPSLFQPPPRFSEYDLSAVVLSELIPPGVRE
ncbi:MAG: hypothetical protein SGPRY_002472, partial [Prymnesium sp.]